MHNTLLLNDFYPSNGKTRMRTLEQRYLSHSDLLSKARANHYTSPQYCTCSCIETIYERHFPSILKLLFETHTPLLIYP